MADGLARVESRDEDGRTLIRLTGEIDLSNADALQRRLEADASGARLVVLDLTGVGYLDSQGLRLLVRLDRRLRLRGVELALVAPPDSVAGEVLRLSGMAGGPGGDAPP